MLKAVKKKFSNDSRMIKRSFQNIYLQNNSEQRSCYESYLFE